MKDIIQKYIVQYDLFDASNNLICSVDTLQEVLDFRSDVQVVELFERDVDYTIPWTATGDVSASIAGWGIVADYKAMSTHQ